MSEPLMPVRVWDLPTRAFHWVLATCVIGSLITAYTGGNAMVWHFRLGYAVLTLLAFRVVWGVIGGHWSRFSNFIYSPSTVLRYLRGESEHHEHHDVGHSPLGAFSVFALLTILAVQAGTGLFADDEIANTGPLIRFVSGATSLGLTSWHKTYGQWLILSLIALHIAAIAFYLIKRKRNLVHPMLVGDKLVRPGVPASVDHWSARVLAAIVLTLCAVGVGWLVSLGQ